MFFKTNFGIKNMNIILFSRKKIKKIKKIYTIE